MLRALPLAVNYSREARALLLAGEVSIDVWKCAPPEELGGFENAAGTAHPAYVHFPFDAGRLDLLETDWDAVERVLDATGTPHVNFHLNARRKDFAGVAEADLDGEVRARFLGAAEEMVRRFGPERVVAENVVYRGEDGPFLGASVEPELIREVVESSGCRFLLDTAHATLTSASMGLADPRAYVETLPCHRLAELHVTGIAPDEGGRLRDSMPMTEADWSLAEWALGRVRAGGWPKPRMVALEYGGVGPIFEWRSRAEVIREELGRLGDLLCWPQTSS